MPYQWFFWKTALNDGRSDFAWRIAETALRLWEREVRASYACCEHFSISSGRGCGWHHFSALSAPVLNFHAAYYSPGTLTSGYDVLRRSFACGAESGMTAELVIGGEAQVVHAGADDPALLGVLGEGGGRYDDPVAVGVERVGDVPDDVGRPGADSDAVRTDVERLGNHVLQLGAGVVGVVADAANRGRDDVRQVLWRSEGVEVVAVVLHIVQFPGLSPVDSLGEPCKLRPRWYAPLRHVGD